MITEEPRITLKKKFNSGLKHSSTKRPIDGFLPSQFIDIASHLGIIHSRERILDQQFQPVSIDLTLGGKVYRIQSSFLPEKETVEQKLKDLKLYEFDIWDDGGILEKECIYLIPLQEELVLPQSMYGRTNPKSSTGRIDMFTRVIIDRGHRFDEITKGYRGKMYLEVIPRSFPVRVKQGLSLNQLRLYQGEPYKSDQLLKKYYSKNPILFNKAGIHIPWEQVKVEDGIFISVDIEGNGKKNSVVAYKARTNSNVIDLSKVRHHKASDYWEEIRPQKKNRLILEPESFYIMMSKEKICIWPDILAEMVAYEPNSGELRTHYAGFFDPGFGWNGTDEPRLQGTRAVMEVRPHDVPFMVEDGQTFCRLKFEKLIELPTKVYGKDIKSNYSSQALTLSKYFKK